MCAVRLLSSWWRCHILRRLSAGKAAVISRLRHFISANAFAGLRVLIAKSPVNNLNHGQEKEEADETVVLVSFLKSDRTVFLFQLLVY